MSSRITARPPWPRVLLLIALGVVAIAWAGGRRLALAGNAGDHVAAAPVWAGSDAWTKPGDEVLRARLNELQYRVTQEDATEVPFRNAYWNEKAPGIYVDIVSGEPLFSSLDKFASGTGWPSFTRPLPGVRISEDTDHKLGYARTEVRSPVADSHLGHVFPDGPPPTGNRYCINSAALDFVPLAALEVRGYGEYVPTFLEAGYEMPKTEIAILAGGCYWGMEDLIRELPGVVDTEVGFCGGTVPNVKYEDLRGSDTGHAESIRVEFDPSTLPYAELLDFFFRIHDPTTVDRQGNDRGAQYRSAIFVQDDVQRATAERVKAEWDKSGRWKAPIVTEIATAGEFWPAKEGHQDYLEKIPNGYTCHFLRDWDEE